MVEWRFGENADDGEQWLEHPDVMYAYVEYRKPQEDWRRLMVATKGWLFRHLNEVKTAADHPRWVVVPTILVLPDERGESLRRSVDTVMKQGGFDSYSTPI
jgi:hypothetical protein